MPRAEPRAPGRRLETGNLIRSCWIGLVSGAGAVVAHGYAMGSDLDRVSWITSALIASVAVLISYGILRRARTWGAALAVTLVEQAAAHLALSGDGHHHAVSSGVPSPDGITVAVGTTPRPGTMLGLHIAVAVATAVFVVGGDRLIVAAAIASVLSWLKRFLPGRSPLVALPLRTDRRRAHRVHAATGVVALPTTRGPPVVLC